MSDGVHATRGRTKLTGVTAPPSDDHCSACDGAGELLYVSASTACVGRDVHHSQHDSCGALLPDAATTARVHTTLHVLACLLSLKAAGSARAVQHAILPLGCPLAPEARRPA